MNKKDHFFGKGNWAKANKGECTFKRVYDSDNIILATTNIKQVKGKAVLIVYNNKGVYLKDWQLLKCYNKEYGIKGYVVKLNRNYFKPFTFNFSFSDLIFDKEEDFDLLYQIAKIQEKENLPYLVY